MKIKSFCGTSENAVYSQIWVALILTILLWIIKTTDEIQKTFHELLITIKASLLTKNSLVGLCTNMPVPEIPDDFYQPLLQGVRW